MAANSAIEHLSQIYPDNPYNYSYYDFSLLVNVSTLAVQQYGDSGIVNQIQATIYGTQHQTKTIPTP